MPTNDTHTGAPCWYCGRQAPRRLVREHAVPRSSGGKDSAENTMPACQACNALKGARGVEEFRRMVAVRADVPAAAVVFSGEGGSATIGALLDRARAPNTLRAYRSDWAHFTAWCEGQGVPSLPAAPETVAGYLAAHADVLTMGTLQRRLAAIAYEHRKAGQSDPCSSDAVRARRTEAWCAHGTEPARKAPVVTDELRRMVEALPEGLLGVRDRALLLVGFAGAFRRSELVGIDRADVAFTLEGLIISLRRSKTDQEGEGRKVGIPYGSRPETCPVRALAAWVEAAGITEGPIFRPVNRHGQVQPGRLSGHAVALVVKRSARAAGLDAANYAGHSLRAGLATSAAAAGASERAIMAQTGHKSTAMVRRYIRDGSLFRENAAAVVGL